MKKKFLKTTAITLIVIVLLIVLALVFPTWTPSIKGDNSISTLQQVDINGTGHEVMIRGVDRSNPVILFVHGGPGCSEIPYVVKYQQLLERDYTIVHYDQRGSGKSYHFFEDYSNLSTDLLVDDLLELTDYVRGKLEQDKVILIGHSFGTYIGTKAAAKAPEKFYAYIGIGQMADTKASEVDSLEYSIEQARLAGNQSDVDMLEGSRAGIERGEALAPRTMVRKYGGAARLIDDNRDYVTGFLLRPEYNLLDVVRFLKGVIVSQDLLLPEALQQHLTELVPRLEIPTYFVMGKYDYMTTVQAARSYFDTLEAPLKDFVVFDQSAHYPQFEEKELFSKWLNEAWGQIKPTQ